MRRSLRQAGTLLAILCGVVSLLHSGKVAAYPHAATEFVVKSLEIGNSLSTKAIPVFNISIDVNSLVAVSQIGDFRVRERGRQLDNFLTAVMRWHCHFSAYIGINNFSRQFREERIFSNTYASKMHDIISGGLPKILDFQDCERADSRICPSRIGWLKDLSWLRGRQGGNIHHVSSRDVNFRPRLVATGCDLQISDSNETTSNNEQKQCEQSKQRIRDFQVKSPEYRPVFGAFFVAAISLLGGVVIQGYSYVLWYRKRYFTGMSLWLFGLFLGFEGSIGFLLRIDLWSIGVRWL